MSTVDARARVSAARLPLVEIVFWLGYAHHPASRVAHAYLTPEPSRSEVRSEERRRKNERHPICWRGRAFKNDLLVPRPDARRCNDCLRMLDRDLAIIGLHREGVLRFSDAQDIAYSALAAARKAGT